MPRMTLQIAIGLLAATVPLDTAPLQAAEPIRGGMIGHRGDGTGVFPDDCRPVTAWSESENIVWKTPLPNLGHSSPICVGRKVLLTCEPGWASDAPLLVCVDADSGRILWQRAIDPFDLLDQEEQAEAKALRKRFFELWREAFRLNHAARGADEQQLANIKAQAERLGIPVKTKGQSTQIGHAAFWHGETPPYKILKKKYGFRMPIWHYAVAGMTHATPVSDGRHVYVVTADRVVACHTLDGERVWMRWHRDEPYTGYRDEPGMHFTASFVPSPILDGDRLIVNANIRLRAYRKQTGETLWDRKLEQINYMVGPPVRLDVPGHGRCVFAASGGLFAADTGEPIVLGAGQFSSAVGHIALGPDTVFSVNGASGGHYKILEGRRFTAAGGVALRFGPDASVEQLWHVPKIKITDHMPVYFNGVIFCDDFPIAYDARTGAVIGRADRRAKKYQSSEGLVVAGGHLFTLNRFGKSAVFKADASMELLSLNELDETAPIEGAKRDQIIAQTGLDEPDRWYAWQFGRTSPFFSGNRMFIRSFDYLYCIGNADEPFTPSKAFGSAD